MARVDPAQCRQCEYRIRSICHDGKHRGCDLLIRTGICRSTDPEAVDRDGRCKYFLPDLERRKWAGRQTEDAKREPKPRKERKKVFDPKRPDGPGRPLKPVVKIDSEGRVLERYSGAPEAARAEGITVVCVYNACNWRARAASDPRRRSEGSCGRKGYTWRYEYDEEVKYDNKET